MEDWVLDSLVGFLKSPMWNDPVNKFIDRNCVVFDPGEENKFSYTDIHREYQKLVEDLLEGFTTDLGIGADQFTQACSQLQTSKAGQENEELFEQVLAADDFLLFKEAMVHRNIDLELQALTLIRKQMGHSPSAYDKERAGEQPGTSVPKTSQQRLEEEERVLEEVMKLSEAQYKLECSMAELLEQAKVESLQMYRQSQQQQDREQGGEVAVGQEEGGGEQQIAIGGDGRGGKEGSGAAESRGLTGGTGGREGAPSKEREGAPSKEREGPQKREGPPSKEREGAPSKEREGAPSKERESAPSKEREGSLSKEREGTPSKERAGTSSVHSEANGHSSESVVPQPWTATAGKESKSGGKSEMQPQGTAAMEPTKSKEEMAPHVKILPALVGQMQSLPAALGTAGEVKTSASESGDMSGVDAVARWLQGAQSDQHSDPNAAGNRSGNSPSTPASGPTPEQLKAREQYLRRQRDRLLEMKKQQRAHVSHAYKAGSGGSSHPKSPQGAQEADKGDKTGGGVGGKERGGGGGRGRRGGRHGRDTGVLSSAIVGSLKKV